MSPLCYSVLLYMSLLVSETLRHKIEKGLRAVYRKSTFHSVNWCNWHHKSHSKSLKQYQCNWVTLIDTREWHQRVTLESDTTHVGAHPRPLDVLMSFLLYYHQNHHLCHHHFNKFDFYHHRSPLLIIIIITISIQRILLVIIIMMTDIILIMLITGECITHSDRRSKTGKSFFFRSKFPHSTSTALCSWWRHWRRRR